MQTAAIYTLNTLSAEQLKKISSDIQSTVPVTTYNHNASEFVIEGTTLVKYQGSSKKPSLPAYITEIAPLAFKKNIYVEELIIPPNITTIGGWAFASCKNLKKVALPKNLRTLCYYTFTECSNLSEISFPDELVTIEGSAFYKCSSLKKIKLPKSVQIVYAKAFVGFNGKIIAPSHLRDIVAFRHNPVEFYDMAASTQSRKPAAPTPNATKINTHGNNATEFVIEGTTLVKYRGSSKKPSLPAYITEIAPFAFEKNIAVEELVIPLNVTTIGKWAFAFCKNLKKVTLPKKLRTLCYYTFVGCSNLSEIVLPDELVAIEESAFFKCPSLKEIKLPKSVRVVHARAFLDFKGKITAPSHLRGHKAFERHTICYYDNQE